MNQQMINDLFQQLLECLKVDDWDEAGKICSSLYNTCHSKDMMPEIEKYQFMSLMADLKFLLKEKSSEATIETHQVI